MRKTFGVRVASLRDTALDRAKRWLANFPKTPETLATALRGFDPKRCLASSPRALQKLWPIIPLILAAGIAYALLPKPSLYPEGITFSHRIEDRNGALLHLGLTKDDKYRVRTPLEDISPALIEATLLHEDRSFYDHGGIDLRAVIRSAWHTVTGGRRTGASTISMQLARLRFGIVSRSPLGKLHQMYRAIQLERHYPKTEILEAYLNLAPYGGNLEGIGAASLIYLGKAPAQLTRREAVALSVIPQSPARRTPPRDGGENAALTAAQSRLFARIRELESAEANPLDARFTVHNLAARPVEALHFVRRLKDPKQEMLATTLDLDLQHVLERSLRGYMARRGEVGLNNACALLVDFKSRDVLAYLGSADFWNVPIEGQVDGIRARRSPGSTLKPFVYGLALEQGIIHPMTMLKDSQRAFGAYQPENYDRGFIGPVSATEALQRSRNVPAVDLAARVKKPGLYGLLAKSGIQLPHNEGYYGLSIVLGGGEVSLEELVRLYAALPNQGVVKPLRMRLDAPAGEARQILSPAAAFMTLEMIRDVPAPGLSQRLGVSADRPVYWKTGTSHGFRDAWSIAVFDRYVLGVWLGNFRGQGNAALIARDAAAPLLFDMIESLRARDPQAPKFIAAPPPGSGVKRVDVCAASGQMPGRFCTSKRSTWFLPGVSPIHTCRVHQEVLVDVASGLRLAPGDDDGTRQVRRAVFEFWPSDMMRVFDSAGIAPRTPPPFHPDSCAIRQGGTATQLAILSPRPDAIYTRRNSSESAQSIPLRVTAEADVRQVYWFADKQFLGSSSPLQPLEWKNAAAGSHRVRAIDDHGRVSEVKAEVRVIE